MDISDKPVIVISKPKFPKFVHKKTVLSVVAVLVLMAIISTLWYLTWSYIKDSQNKQTPLLSAEVRKQADMLKVNGGMEEKEALEKANTLIQRREKIKIETTRRNISVSREEIASKEAEYIKNSDKATIQAVLSRYNWTTKDWERNIYFDLLEEKLRKAVSKWRDYQYIMIRWDVGTNENITDKQIDQTVTPILTKVKQRLEKGEPVDKVFKDTQADKSITSPFAVQGITDTQRIYFEDITGDDHLLSQIFALPYPSISSIIKDGASEVIVKVTDGNDGDSSLDKLLSSSDIQQFANKQLCATYESKDTSINILGVKFKIPSIIKKAEASYFYCSYWGTWIYDARVHGRVVDNAGIGLAGVTVRAVGMNTSMYWDCKCTNTSGTKVTDANGYFLIDKLCCKANNFKISASKPGYDCSKSTLTSSGVNLPNVASYREIGAAFTCIATTVTMNPPVIDPNCKADLTFSGSVSWSASPTTATGPDGSLGYWVDVDNEPSFGSTFSNKFIPLSAVPNNSTTLDNFNPPFQLKGDGTTYYMRVFNGYGHSNTITVSKICPVTVYSPTKTGCSALSTVDGKTPTYTGSVSWSSTSSGGYWVDIDTDPYFGGTSSDPGDCNNATCSHKWVSGTTTTFPDGFDPPLEMLSDKTYYLRVFNGEHSYPAQVITQSCTGSVSHTPPACIIDPATNTCTVTENWSTTNVDTPQLCRSIDGGLTWQSVSTSPSGTISNVTVPKLPPNNYVYKIKILTSSCGDPELAIDNITPGTGLINLPDCIGNSCPADPQTYIVDYTYNNVPGGASLYENGTKISSDTVTNHASSPITMKKLSGQTITYRLVSNSGQTIDTKTVLIRSFAKPWIKTTTGDIHSNTSIDVSGGR